MELRLVRVMVCFVADFNQIVIKKFAKMVDYCNSAIEVKGN